MLLIKNKDGSRTIVPEGDESDILDHIEINLGQLGFKNFIQDFIDQRRNQKDYEEVVMLHRELKKVSKFDRDVILVETISKITDCQAEMIKVEEARLEKIKDEGKL